MRTLTRSWSHCGVDKIVVWYAFGFGDQQTSMFSVVFVPHILQKGLLVLASIWSLVFRINIHSLVPVPKQSQLPQMIKDMCYNDKNTSCTSNFSIIFGQLLPRKLHRKLSVIILLWLFLCQISHHAIHMIERVIVDSDDVMQSKSIPCQHPQGPVPEWP